MTKFVSKSWGYEEWLVNNEKYCSKILFVKRGLYCSYHYHKIKDETFYILKGKILLFYNKEEVDDILCSDIFELVPGDVFHIPVLARHRFLAIKDSKIIETSTQHFDIDSYRIPTPNWEQKTLKGRRI